MNRSNSRDGALLERAEKVIPNGVWGHMATRVIGPGYPQFFSKSDGCRVWDADGNEYIDFMCAWGPNLLGYRHAGIDEAALAQIRNGDIANGPSELMVDLAELLVDTIDYAEWAMFQKNGTDATTACVTIARAATGKRKILVAKGSYHGAVPWCSPSMVGVTSEDRAHILAFEYNDMASFDEAVASAGDDLAAVLLTAFRHDANRDQELPEPRFLRHVRAVCDRTGAALVLDDVRAGFRLDVRGSWARHGVKPDLGAYSKAIANGWPLAAVVGNRDMLAGASRVFVTGSFWYGAAAMAAAIATVRTLRETDALDYIEAMGQLFCSGIEQAAERHGFRLHVTGPVQMPMIRFDNDADLTIANTFCAAALRHGIYLHPKHNMFICAAHQASDIDAALSAADSAFADIARLADRTPRG
ncbi:aminotransferase class III-fold pyridoxal phosphate-dependent enzyme [Aquamicrobium defluvii]|uniref:Glutamate-1-semialdehyde 2,1-aminomutase n=1 Tax=Aquamicrobium defluvii TaxID=69279 RepID=A0A011U274_9HYPH|nr:aminotransferase class III-fold pyridoxal phosphate-dependent enzyme [Aquamicrobium defluvii]EXL10537.1 glutamate-1-semialdehyde 2,1-aminomutase [Aquamicrobium defluvii]EZQ17713.1 glutamate-1-semialdehyde 2,1-aminomutase [Halopseudomonas bauzanensis]